MKTLVNMMAAVVLPVLAVGAAELEGWWRFAEADGDEAADASGRGRAALLDTNRVWRVTDAPGGGALWFDGVTNVTAAARLGRDWYAEQNSAELNGGRKPLL